jgi:hypothetical protein
MSSSNKAPAKMASEVQEPHAIVTACDGSGAYLVYGIYPNNGHFSLYAIAARIVEGVLEGIIHTRIGANYVESITAREPYTIRITLAEALVLFLDPLVARQKKLPPLAISVIRWWQQHRRPGPHRHEELVMPLLGKRELTRIAESYTPTKAIEYLVKMTVAEREALKEHQERFERHFYASKLQYRSWLLNEVELRVIGVTRESEAWSNPNVLKGEWMKSERLLRRHIHMAAHMRLLYTLGGDFPDIVDLWSKEVKFQAELGHFGLSGQAICVCARTIITLQKSSLLYGNEGTHYQFFGAPKIEQDGIQVLRGAGAWARFVSVRESLMLEIIEENICFLAQGVADMFQNLIPNFVTVFKKDFIEELAQLLLDSFVKWHVNCVYRHEGPLASADKDPPSDFVKDILNLINQENDLVDHGHEASRGLSQAFWDVACMATHPELFDYPTETGGHGVRKTTSTSIAPSRRPTFEEALRVLVEALCSSDRWLVQLSRANVSTLKKCFTVALHTPETASVERIFCPIHFSLDNGTIVPSDELLQRATNGDDRYFTNLLKLMAVQVPYTTLSLLDRVRELGDELNKTHEKALSNFEENRSTSTTKKQKGQCAGCGTKEETVKRLMKCTRCEIVRYCSVGCQKKHWCVHKKVCVPVSK